MTLLVWFPQIQIWSSPSGDLQIFFDPGFNLLQSYTSDPHGKNKSKNDKYLRLKSIIYIYEIKEKNLRKSNILKCLALKNKLIMS